MIFSFLFFFDFGSETLSRDDERRLFVAVRFLLLPSIELEVGCKQNCNREATPTTWVKRFYEMISIRRWR